MMTRLALVSVFLLQGCAVVAEYPVTSASLAVWGVTGKGPADHALSAVAERDCATLRIIDGKKICQDYVLAEVKDVSTKVDVKRQEVYTTIAQANDVFAQRARAK